MSFSGTKRRYSSLLTVLLLSTALSGCDQLFNIAVACIDDDRPVLSPKELPNPILNQEYNEVIHVGIRNEPRDDRFDYTFTLTGNLPMGMQSESIGRDLRLFGIPTALGDYKFSVRVEIENGANGYNNTEGLCSTIDSEDYQWAVQVM